MLVLTLEKHSFLMQKVCQNVAICLAFRFASFGILALDLGSSKQTPARFELWGVLCMYRCIPVHARQYTHMHTVTHL